MRKTLELGSWVSKYFEGRPADYTEGGFEVRDGKGRRFVYSQVEGLNGRLKTRMSLEWEISDGKVIEPFRLSVIEAAEDETEMSLRIQAQHPRWSGFSGVSLDYKDNQWTYRGDIWFDPLRSDLAKMHSEMKKNLPVSRGFEYCVPVNLDETLALWLAKLDNGDFSMPVIVSARTVMIGDFGWDVPFQSGGMTYWPGNTRRLMQFLTDGRGNDGSRRQEIFRKVMEMECAMRLRFLQEKT